MSLRAFPPFFVLVLLSLAVMRAQDNDGGYRRQLNAAREELKVETLKTDRLIELLADDWFYNREAASLELPKRGIADYDKLLRATADVSPERSRRAAGALRGIASAHYRTLEKAHQPRIAIVVSSPRFWSGTNSYRGGIQDTSLDADVAITADPPLEGVTSPVPIQTAKTNTGEKIEMLEWGSWNGATTSAVVYFTKPMNKFEHIDATLSIRSTRQLPPLASSLKFDCGTFVLEKDVVWCVLSKDKKEEGKYVYVVTDILGRLDRTELKLLDKDETTSAAKVVISSGEFERAWWIDTNKEKDCPARIDLLIPGPKLYFEENVKVRVPCPKLNR